MEQNIEVSQIKKRTVISSLSLFFQSGYSAVLGLIANLVLTVILSPKIFGVYITVLSTISILNYFSDIGLAASLVQKDKVEDEDLKTAFTIQQMLVIVVVIIGFLASNFISKFYHLPPEGIYLYKALLIAFFLSSLKTIPSVLLERKIKFQKIVIVQIAENTIFYLSVIILGLMNFGLQSFTYSVLLRSIVGLILIYTISFWSPKIGISIKSLKRLLSFGIPFQTNSLLALVKDDLMILFLGKLLGFEKLGYIGWAKKWAEAPIRIIMDNLSRVVFPLISRLQNNKEKVSSLIEKILFYQTATLFPAMVGLILVMNKFIEIVPKYSKWQPALPIFYIFCISALLSTLSTPFINLFNALGKVKISFTFMLMWTIGTWLLTPILTKFFGIYGFPITLAILSSFFILVIYQAKKLINIKFVKSIYPFAISSLIMALIILSIKSLQLEPRITLIATIFVGIISYIIITKVIFRINLLKELKLLLNYE